jgi:hypothetical protein
LESGTRARTVDHGVDPEVALELMLSWNASVLVRVNCLLLPGY